LTIQDTGKEMEVPVTDEDEDEDEDDDAMRRKLHLYPLG
jgi:hypothetical protein